MNEKVFVIGGGGHAKVAIATLQAAGRDVVTILDDDPAKWGSLILGIPVTGPIDAISRDSVGEGLIAIGNSRIRRELDRKLESRWATAIHPSAVVHPSARIAPGTVVFAGAVVQPDVVIGRHAIINTGATIDHDCVIGDYAHVAPGAHLAGGVRLEEGAMVGIGAVAIPCVRIGAWSNVGAGGAVIRDVPEATIVVGVPAVPKR